MRTVPAPRTLGTFLGLLLLCSRATADPVPPQLPADVTLNKDAGAGGLVFVTLHLESGEELPFFLDTGSPVTCVDKSLEPKLGKCLDTGTIALIGGKQHSGRYVAPSLYLGSTPLIITRRNVFTFDFTQLSAWSGRPIVGLLGMDCLGNYCIQLDFAAGKLRFLEPDHLQAAALGKAFPLEVSSKGQNATLPFLHHGSLIGGEGTKLLLDTGCNTDGFLQAGLFRRQLRKQRADLAPDGTAQFPNCVWNGQTYTNLTLGKVPNRAPDAMGLGFLARHLVTLDFPNRTLYLDQTSVGPLVFENVDTATPDSIPPPLPADVTLNKDAGRWGFLFVTLRLESGQELPFVVDSGNPVTLFDKSLKPKLGRPLITMTIHQLDGKQESDFYAAPKLYLGGTPLRTDSYIGSFDFKRLSSLCGHPVKGVLGMDCLRHYCVQLDFAAGKMRFLDPRHLDSAGLGKPFALTFSTENQNFPPMFYDARQNQSLPYIHHPGLLGGPITNLLIDSGDNVDGAVEKGALQGLYLTRFLHFFARHRALRLPECVWDGATYTKLCLSGAGGRANRLGLRFLARHLVTFDFPDRTLYLKRISAGPLADESTKPAAQSLLK